MNSQLSRPFMPAFILAALTASGIEVDRTEVRLPNGAIRHTGEFNVAVQLHHDVTAEVLVTVVSE